MTTNAFIFAWDQFGIESIVPITQYENIDKDNLFRILKEEERIRNPLDGIVRSLILRAQVNSHRSYEIYAVDCAPEMDLRFWQLRWAEDPQGMAEIMRERGHKLFSSKETRKTVIK
jgi:hypothetical protein